MPIESSANVVHVHGLVQNEYMFSLNKQNQVDIYRMI